MSKTQIKKVFLVFLLTVPVFLHGQNKLNFGLASPQDQEMLPKSNAEIVMPERKAKVQAPTKLDKVQNNEYILTSGWELTDANKIVTAQFNIFNEKFNTSDWYNATVPGTVLTTLVDQGVYPDPYFGINNLAIPDSLSRMDWWYRIPFELPEEGSGNKVWLVFNGINYKAQVWLNGTMLGTMKGAFKRGEFDATNIIKKTGQNILAVHIFPPPNPGIPHEESARTGQGPNGGALSLDGPTFISSEGWDWIPGIRDRNIGIWQDVRLKFTGNVKIENPQIVTDLPLPDLNSARIEVTTTLVNTSRQEQTITLKGKIENITFSKKITLAAGASSEVSFSPAEFKQLVIRKPRLWWPNGYGKPELYKLELSVEENGKTSDLKTTSFGIRELSYDLTVDTPSEQERRIEFNPINDIKDGVPLFDNINRREIGGEITIPKLFPGVDEKQLKSSVEKSAAPYIVFRVNGKKIFCKGGNWGMDDGMKRVSRERLEPYIRLHREANYNMIRNWTAESTEEEFYQLCDEYGMLVWNDFWLSTEGFNLEPLDNNLTIQNATDVVKRFRNHPSIAIWCPRNEGYAPKALEEAFSSLIAKEDGTRLYIGNSRYLNLRPSGPWHFFKNPKEYFTNNAQGFTTEIGTFSIPTASTIRKFMAKEDQWPINDVWHYHDLHKEHALEDYLKAIENQYGKGKDLDDFTKKAQLVNYNSHRSIFESWNSKLWNNSSGILLWMTHPAWPSMIWQTYSWDYETHGSFYGSKKACEPIHIQMNLPDNKVVIINSSLAEYKNATATVEVFELGGKKLFSKEQKINIPANQKTDLFSPDIANVSDIYLVRLILKDSKGIAMSINDYLRSKEENFTDLNELKSVALTSAISKNAVEDGNKVTFELKNPSETTAVAIKLKLVNVDTNAQILPAYFSDGYFNLIPGESRKFTVDHTADKNTNLKIVFEGYNSSGSLTLDVAKQSSIK